MGLFDSVNPVAAIGPAIGLLGGLFGKKSNNQASGYYGQASGAYNREGQIGNQIGANGAQAMGSFNTYDPQYQGAVNARAAYLKTDPYTDTRDSADLNRATAGLNHQYDTAGANLSADMARRGLDTGDGGQNSMLAGGVASLLASKASAHAGAQNAQAYNQIAQRNSNSQQLVGLLGGAADGYYSRGAQAQTEDANIQGNVAGGFNNMGNASLAQNNFENGQANAVMGQAGNSLGYLLGRGKTPMGGGGFGGFGGFGGGYGGGYGGGQIY